MSTELARNPRRVSKRRAAAYASIDRHALERLIEQGLVKVYRAGEKTFRIDLDQLDAAMLAYGTEEPP